MSHEWDSTRHRLIASASSNGVGNDHRRDDVKLLRSTDLSDLDADHRRGSYSTIVARVDFEKVPSLLLLQLCFRLLPTSVQTGPAAAKLFLPTWDPSRLRRWAGVPRCRYRQRSRRDRHTVFHT